MQTKFKHFDLSQRGTKLLAISSILSDKSCKSDRCLNARTSCLEARVTIDELSFRHLYKLGFKTNNLKSFFFF